jgi:hypothetical protein
MSALGWVFMLVSWGFILGLAIYCFYRVLAMPRDREPQ